MVPNVSRVLNGWMKNTVYYQVRKSVVDHQTVENRIRKSALMMIQPTPLTEVNRKPEEQRAWKWQNIVSKIDLCLNIDSVLYIDNVEYRVKAINNNLQYGYIRYQCVEGYTA